jgi:putative addiction module component (TIGR02574 family)
MYSLFMNTVRLNFKTLPISERIELVEDIWDSIAEETPSSLDLSDAERAELHRRFAAHQANPSSGVPWEQVRAALFKGQH